LLVVVSSYFDTFENIVARRPDLASQGLYLSPILRFSKKSRHIGGLYWTLVIATGASLQVLVIAAVCRLLLYPDS